MLGPASVGLLRRLEDNGATRWEMIRLTVLPEYTIVIVTDNVR